MKTTKDGVAPNKINIGDKLYLILPDEKLPEGWYLAVETVADISVGGYYRSTEDAPGDFTPLDGWGAEIFWNEQAAADRLKERISDHIAGKDYIDPYGKDQV